jgi:hypothetical protein
VGEFWSVYAQRCCVRVLAACVRELALAACALSRGREKGVRGALGGSGREGEGEGEKRKKGREREGGKGERERELERRRGQTPQDKRLKSHTPQESDDKRLKSPTLESARAQWRLNICTHFSG